MATTSESAGPAHALTRLSRALRALRLDLEAGDAATARTLRDELVAQIDDYLLPRLRQMDAPLLMVVGGSTGAGKSTLVNSLLGREVTPPGVLRPTTRAPVLACHPSDVHWFETDRILPGMARSRGGPAGPGGLQLVEVDTLPPGLALLDSPDVDSVEELNRDLARQLLSAADAWLFVTTAARYADAVPWELLHVARDRGTALSLVLDRTPPEAIDEVSRHLGQMLDERGLGAAELLVVPEARLEAGLLPAAALAPVAGWLEGLAADAGARADLVRRTLPGALASLPGRVERIEGVLAEQLAAVAQLEADVAGAYEAGVRQVDDAVRSGSLLRGEVLARWHDVVGTGEIMRAMESRIGWLRDRVRALVTAGPAPDRELRDAVESSVDGLVHAAGGESAEGAAAAWRQRPAGRRLLSGAERLGAASAELLPRTRQEVRAWQGFVFDLVSEEGAGKRSTARLASLGVNGAGLTVMLAVFVQTGGLTGAEVVVAGGTSALSQKVLEALFGDQAVRSLAQRARADLLERVRLLLEQEARRYRDLLEPVAPDRAHLEELRAVRAELGSHT